jgi:hypothetical protein
MLKLNAAFFQQTMFHDQKVEPWRKVVDGSRTPLTDGAAFLRDIANKLVGIHLQTQGLNVWNRLRNSDV